MLWLWHHEKYLHIVMCKYLMLCCEFRHVVHDADIFLLSSVLLMVKTLRWKCLAPSFLWFHENICDSMKMILWFHENIPWKWLAELHRLILKWEILFLVCVYMAAYGYLYTCIYLSIKVLGEACRKEQLASSPWLHCLGFNVNVCFFPEYLKISRKRKMC